ncbi:hypothetical protein GN244_ATG13834 [Phytophthora infestans]|uniref:Transmembrane protein n=1 Tax=Phytophthora infestans TaxID=4787 RepID=A0A833W9S0_PHYIN|nr:hypothetical protein GN244_ATG13834 [Phytophthora infestans]
MAPNATEKLHDEEDRGVLVYDAPGFFANDSKVPRWIQSLVTDVFSFVILHYFVWGVPFLVLFYIFHKVSGAGTSPDWHFATFSTFLVL